MSWIASGALFLSGAYLGMRVIAAVYRVVDLWYTIATAYPRVIRGILGWGGTTLASAALLGDRHRQAFLCGLAAFLLFYLSLYVLRHLLLRKPAPLQ